MYDFIKNFLKQLKLIVLFWTRIVFVKNNFQCSILKKIQANFSGGYLADQWVLYDFDHNDKNEYLSEFDWYKSRYINEPFDCVMNNKVITAEILKQYVRVPQNYFLKNKGFLTDYKSRPATYSDIIKVLHMKKTLFLKPISAGKGNGVDILEFNDDLLRINKDVVSEKQMEEYLSKRNCWFICEVIQQHSYLDNIYNKTFNTIRMIVLRDVVTKEFKIFFAVQRIGTSETIPVDNGSKGGLVSKIDLETGELSEARCLRDKQVYISHPDSGSMIKGVRIPNWKEIKKEVLALSNKMPYMHFIAWDILITEEGVCIIEGNTSSGINIIQLWGGQKNKELGTFYRFHNVIK